MDNISAARKAGKVGQIITTIKPVIKTARPLSIPTFRPRLSPINARNGLKTPVNERSVSAREIVVRSTPIPLANTARNGYTMRNMVFSTTRVAVNSSTWMRRGVFNLVLNGFFSRTIYESLAAREH